MVVCAVDLEQRLGEVVSVCLHVCVCICVCMCLYVCAVHVCVLYFNLRGM